MSLKDKASRINFSGLPALGAAAPDSVAPEAVASETAGKLPRTAPGQLMQLAASQREELVRRIQELEQQLANAEHLKVQAERSAQLEGALAEARAELAQWDGAKGVRLLAVEDVTTSRFANRHADSFSSKDFEGLVAEIASAGGNVQPVKVRPLAVAREGARYELVYGHRRLQACRRLGLPVLAMVDNIDDRALFAEMERENRGRQNLAPWEQGLMYRRALDEGLFASMRQMAELLGANVSAVSRALALASLPEHVVLAFRSPLELQFRWAKPLGDALAADPKGVQSRAQIARGWVPRKPASDVFRFLVQGEGSEPASATADKDAERTSVEQPLPLKQAGRIVATVHRSVAGLRIDWQQGPFDDARFEQCLSALRSVLDAP